MIRLRSPRPPGLKTDSLGLQSNFQISLPVAASKPRSQPSQALGLAGRLVALTVGTAQLPAVAEVIDPIAVHGRRRGNPVLGKIIFLGVVQFVVDRLPQELAVRLAQAEEDALVAFDRRI